MSVCACRRGFSTARPTLIAGRHGSRSQSMTQHHDRPLRLRASYHSSPIICSERLLSSSAQDPEASSESAEKKPSTQPTLSGGETGHESISSKLDNPNRTMIDRLLDQARTKVPDTRISSTIRKEPSSLTAQTQSASAFATSNASLPSRAMETNAFARRSPSSFASDTRNLNYVVHVYSTRNNTICSFTKPNGEIIFTVRAGNVGFKRNTASSYEAGFQVGQETARRVSKELFTKIGMHGLSRTVSVELSFSGFGMGREAVFKVSPDDLRILCIRHSSHILGILRTGCRRLQTLHQDPHRPDPPPERWRTCEKAA